MKLKVERQKRSEAKTRDGDFLQILQNEYELSPQIAKSLIKTTREVYKLDKIDPALLGEKGKVVKTVIAQNAQHGPPLKKLKKVEVKLTLHAGKEDNELITSQGKKALRQHQIMRITDEARNQGGVLSQEDLAEILKVTPRTIQRDIKELRDDNIEVLTRGVLEDIGPAHSHKTEIIEMYLQGYTYSRIKLRMRHNENSIQRYLTHFSQVVLLTEKGLTKNEIRFSVGISETLVEEYQRLYQKYNNDEYRRKLNDLITLRSSSNGPQPAKKGVLT